MIPNFTRVNVQCYLIIIVFCQNAFLLTDYAYLSNDSSFSVSNEDGVEVVAQENFSAISKGKSLDKAEKALYSPPTSGIDQTDSSKPSLSFEAQVCYHNGSRCV